MFQTTVLGLGLKGGVSPWKMSEYMRVLGCNLVQRIGQSLKKINAKF